MPKPETDPALIARIKAAPLPGAPDGVSHDALADALGVSRSTVRKYRDEARLERKAATREQVEHYAQETVAGALSGLDELLVEVRASYLARDLCKRDPKTADVWLSALKLQLAQATGKTSVREFDGQSDAQLRELIRSELERE